jgi:hypothetical protein
MDLIEAIPSELLLILFNNLNVKDIEPLVINSKYSLEQYNLYLSLIDRGLIDPINVFGYINRNESIISDLICSFKVGCDLTGWELNILEGFKVPIYINDLEINSDNDTDFIDIGSKIFNSITQIFYAKAVNFNDGEHRGYSIFKTATEYGIFVYEEYIGHNTGCYILTCKDWQTFYTQILPKIPRALLLRKNGFDKLVDMKLLENLI